MNNLQEISPLIQDDSQLETEFTCLVECNKWRIEIKFRFHSSARCVRVKAAQGNTERCVNLRADRSTTTADSFISAGFNTAHLTISDSQIPWAQGLDFQALKYAIAIADWVSRFLCLTAEKPATQAQKAIEAMCAELGRRLAEGNSPFFQCL